MLRDLAIYHSLRRVKGVQTSEGSASAAVGMVVGYGIAGHGGFSVVVKIRTRSLLGLEPLTRLRSRNYTCRICRNNFGQFPDESEDVVGNIDGAMADIRAMAQYWNSLSPLVGPSANATCPHHESDRGRRDHVAIRIPRMFQPKTGDVPLRQDRITQLSVDEPDGGTGVASPCKR